MSNFIGWVCFGFGLIWNVGLLVYSQIEINPNPDRAIESWKVVGLLYIAAAICFK